MSEFKIRKLTDRAGTGAPNFTHGFNINGSDSGLVGFAHTEGSSEPSNPSNGDTWWDTGNDKYYVYIDNEFKEYSIAAAATLNYGDKASRAGFGTQQLNSLHTWDITTLGNASDWKDLTRTTTARAAAASSATYGFLFGGNTNGANSGPGVNNVDYYAFANNTNATDFGDLSVASSINSACSNGSRACVQIGWRYLSGSSVEVDTIDYFTMDTPGNATDFGDTTHARAPIGNVQVSNGTRGLFAGGYSATYTTGSNIIDYITIATTGNAIDFGDLTTSRYGLAGCGSGSGDRGLFVSGYPGGSYGVMDYVTISTTGNATDFGDVFIGMSSSSGYIYVGACNNATRAVMLSAADTNRMEYVTMDTTGNAADFGDQTNSTDNAHMACTSGNAS